MPTKLKLARLTLRTLTSLEIAGVAGGNTSNYPTVTNCVAMTLAGCEIPIAPIAPVSPKGK